MKKNKKDRFRDLFVGVSDSKIAVICNNRSNEVR